MADTISIRRAMQAYSHTDNLKRRNSPQKNEPVEKFYPRALTLRSHSAGRLNYH